MRRFFIGRAGRICAATAVAFAALALALNLSPPVRFNLSPVRRGTTSNGASASATEAAAAKVATPDYRLVRLRDLPSNDVPAPPALLSTLDSDGSSRTMQEHGARASSPHRWPMVVVSPVSDSGDNSDEGVLLNPPSVGVEIIEGDSRAWLDGDPDPQILDNTAPPEAIENPNVTDRSVSESKKQESAVSLQAPEPIFDLPISKADDDERATAGSANGPGPSLRRLPVITSSARAAAPKLADDVQVRDGEAQSVEHDDDEFERPAVVYRDSDTPAEGEIVDDDQAGLFVREGSPGPDGLEWWRGDLHRPIGDRTGALSVSLDELLVGALRHSPAVKVLNDGPLIRETAILEAEADFDWRGFMQSKWRDINEPVGNTLVTGGPNRFNDHQWTHSAGARRRNTYGGQFEASQQWGWQNTNSQFFVPKNQGSARLVVSYTQPLLRGRGNVYNTSVIVIAELNALSARDDSLAGIQDHLLEVANAYWELYRARARWMQVRRLTERAEHVLNELVARREIDVVDSQIIQARAAVANRRSDWIRAEVNIKNAETRLRTLVADGDLGETLAVELVPGESIAVEPLTMDAAESMTVAMHHRSEIERAMREIKAASVRLDVADHELLPALDFVVESYVAGLRGSSSIGGAWTDQFTQGAPSYTAGLNFEVPFYQRAAHARRDRRALELRQLENEFKLTVSNIRADVEIAQRGVVAAERVIDAKRESLAAAQAEVDSVEARWRSALSDNRTGSLLLDELLAAQSRMGEAEQQLLESQIAHQHAVLQLKRATGVLLECRPGLQDSEFRGDRGDDLPTSATP